ncbi:hypothetical protein LINPERHAP1_LOCUS37713 [Linum perenne]
MLNNSEAKGYGFISVAGGRGKGGGGGGRVSLDCYSIQEDVKVAVHGGSSIGCPENAGAAGTYFNADLLSLRVGNDNMTTETETPLLVFPTRPLWSNVVVENNAKVLVPLLWSRVQVRGQISSYAGGSIVFGLAAYPVSEFELVAEELLLSDSIIKVYGAFRVAVKILLMWNSSIEIDGRGNTIVTASVFEVRNLIVLRASSVISSNANLGVYGQGLFKLSGQGDAIKSQRLSLSLFYNLTVGLGSLLQAPWGDDASRSVVTNSMCETEMCPADIIFPPDDCHVNYTLSFSLQICRVEDLLVNGIVKGSIIHIHRARTIIIETGGSITASELGCSTGIGKGKYTNGAGSGAGHGGQGGSGYFNGILSDGGNVYGSADLPCELGSGTEGPDQSYGTVIGGGMIVMGSTQWPLLKLDLYGSLSADGQSSHQPLKENNGSFIGGLGGGSGGTILLFLQMLMLAETSSLSALGGNGGSNGGGGGGGGRVHFHWANFETGEEYFPVASINGTIDSRGGAGKNGGLLGEGGTVTGKSCPKGLYGTFCEVRGTRAEETQNHVYRMYFMGPNTFREPWHLPYSPPDAIIDIVYEDAFNRFIDEINSVAAYDWWEGSLPACGIMTTDSTKSTVDSTPAGTSGSSIVLSTVDNSVCTNYVRWSQSVRMYIRVSYLIGATVKPREGDPPFDVWGAENSMVMT